MYSSIIIIIKIIIIIIIIIIIMMMIKLFTDQYNSVKSIFVKRFYRNQAFVSISLSVTSRSPLLKV